MAPDEQQTSSGPGRTAAPNADLDVDVVVIGAGFAGLYMLHRLRGLGLSVRVFEAGDDVGGTWYWNRYPGARCDVESLEYSYSFSPELEQEWDWTERYARQPEILEYIGHVADRFDLRRDIRFSTRVTTAHFDDATSRWTVGTDDGATTSAQWCVMATGCLSSRKTPDFEGLASFAGQWYLTSAWPREGVDLAGKRVGVVGTGSTAIQAIPQIAKQAGHVTVFQRTPNFSVPAQNRPLAAEEQAAMKANYRQHRQQQRESTGGMVVGREVGPSAAAHPADERQRALEARWEEGGAPRFLRAYSDVVVDQDSNDVVAEFVRDKIRSIVRDQSVAELLCPTNHPIGTKRLCVDTEYFETYNRDNITLVDISTAPIEEITPAGIRTGGVEYELDCIVFAIGFDAMTGALFDIDIRGRDGLPLRQKWEGGPRNYLGLGVSGFPNLFTITGPLSPSVLSNMIVSIEQHVDWITDCIAHLREQEIDAIEPTEQAEDWWVDYVASLGNATLFPLANSWYVGANVPGKPRVFLPYVGGVGAYRKICDEVAAKDYEGFVLSGRPHVTAVPAASWG